MTKTAGRVRKWLDLYHHHLNDVLGLAPATRRKYLFVVSCLMGELCPDGKLVSSRFTADAIAGFVNQDAAPRRGQGKRQSLAPVRSFLRFLISHDVLRPGIDIAVPKMNRHLQQRLPQPLTGIEIDRLLGTCVVDDSAFGRRNYAVLLLLIRLGLRVQEIARLQLRDIDWQNGTILIRDAKTRSERLLPLQQDVADALLRYLSKRRLSVKCSEIFMQRFNPFGPQSPDSLAKIVKRLLTKADIRRDSGCSAHLLRHTVATNMVNQGVSIKDVADLLGHQSLQNTAIYAKLNLTTLSGMALPWPGGDQ